MRPLVLAIIWTMSCLTALAADIASVNFKAIKADLREYYFSKAENAAVKKEFEASVQEEKKHMEEIQKSVLDSSKPLDLKSMVPRGGAVTRFDLERKLDGELKKELYVLVSGLGLKYELIYDATDTEAIIYSKSEVDDLTTTVKQAIIDLRNKK